jgi:hypothetical protein
VFGFRYGIVAVRFLAPALNSAAFVVAPSVAESANKKCSRIFRRGAFKNLFVSIANKIFYILNFAICPTSEIAVKKCFISAITAILHRV